MTKKQFSQDAPCQMEQFPCKSLPPQIPLTSTFVTCLPCKGTFVNPFYFQRHAYEVHGQYFCCVCKILYLKLEEYSAHMRMFHQIPRQVLNNSYNNNNNMFKSNSDGQFSHASYPVMAVDKDNSLLNRNNIPTVVL